MKKLLFVSLMVCAVSVVVVAQENPCNTTVFPTGKDTVISGTNWIVTTSFYLLNDVSQNPKGTKIEVINLAGNLIYAEQCFIATNTGQTVSITATIPIGTPFTYRITRYTSSNGQCQGGTCQIVTLPVALATFSAIREGSSVRLDWKTVSEYNNAGFAVQRNSVGQWDDIGFVASSAPSGNSDQPINYSFIDRNPSKAIVQYRLVQKDFDGKKTISVVRMVRGQDQTGSPVVAFPNPSPDGTVTILFEKGTISMPQLFDVTGRPIRQWPSSSVEQSVLYICNLSPGMYFLRYKGYDGTPLTHKILVGR